MSDWTDQIVGDRMAVDRQFNDRIAASEFSSQEWGMIMTAVEFDIETPERPEEATLVARTDDVDQVMGAVDDVREGLGAMGGPAPGGQSGSEGGGLFDSIRGALGLGGGDDGSDARLDSAEALAEEYAQQLERHLKKQGKWERACAAAAGAGADESADVPTDDDRTTPSEGDYDGAADDES